MTMSRRDLLRMFRPKQSAEPAPPAGDSAPPAVELAPPAGELAPPPGIPARASAATSSEVPAAPASPTAAPASPTATAPFSLDAFYAARSAAPALPAFAVKAEVAVASTRVGLGRTEAVSAPPDARPTTAVALPAGLVPRVLDHNCLAARSFCSVCVEHCPRDGAIVIERGRARIVEARCDGCGRCIPVCPAPILALELVPRTTASESP